MKTDILTHNFFFSWPSHLALLLLFNQVFSTGGSLWATATAGHLATCCCSYDSKLRLTDWDSYCQISSGHLHILFHNAHHFHPTTWLLPLIFTGASCAENLWLMAWSRINMQHVGPSLTWCHFLLTQNDQWKFYYDHS